MNTDQNSCGSSLVWNLEMRPRFSMNSGKVSTPKLASRMKTRRRRT
jgi:hypothetical protein